MLSFRRISQSFLACLTAGVLLCGPVAAQDMRAERDRLAAHIQANPDDDQATYRFVVIATELRDYEAGIGALERLLMFNPNLSRARKELGFLYARLGNWEIAGQHLRAARDSGARSRPAGADRRAIARSGKARAARSSVDPSADGRALAIECELLSGRQSFPDRRREPVVAWPPAQRRQYVPTGPRLA